MKTVALGDLNILDVGNEIVLFGTIFHGKGRTFLIPLPDRDPSELEDAEVLRMDTEDMARFLNQTDVQDIAGAGKAILRKSQRHIDRIIQWKVFRRDGFRCRYCGEEAPLTVDHVILWEDGGASVEDNLVSSCGPCNRKRGSMPYELWIQSKMYQVVSSKLDELDRYQNLRVVKDLERLKNLKVKARSR